MLLVLKVCVCVLDELNHKQSQWSRKTRGYVSPHTGSVPLCCAVEQEGVLKVLVEDGSEACPGLSGELAHHTRRQEAPTWRLGKGFLTDLCGCLNKGQCAGGKSPNPH